MTRAEFINKVKDPAILVTIVVACLAAGFTIGYNSNATYIKGIEDDKNDLKAEIVSLKEQNRDLQDLHGNLSFADFLRNLNEVASNIVAQQRLSEAVKRLTSELENKTTELANKARLLEEQERSFDEKLSAQAAEISRLESLIDELTQQIYVSFDEPIVKTVIEGEAAVFSEPHFAVGLRDINSAAHTAKISYNNVHEKEVAVGENIEVEVDGKRCFVRFMHYAEIGSYRHQGTFSFYCSKS